MLGAKVTHESAVQGDARELLWLGGRSWESCGELRRCGSHCDMRVEMKSKEEKESRMKRRNETF